MALVQYMKPIDGLPDPRGLLSTSIPAQAIAEANNGVEKATRNAAGGKRGLYKKYSSTLRSEIARYAYQHQPAAAAWH